MDENKDVNVERTEKKSDSSKVGVAVIKYATYFSEFHNTDLMPHRYDM